MAVTATERADIEREAIREFRSNMGKKGAAARAASLTNRQRKAIASKASKARWDAVRAEKAKA